MLKRNKRSKRHKRKIKLYSLIIFLIGLIISLIDYGYRNYIESLNIKKVNEFINNNTISMTKEKRYNITTKEKETSTNEYIGVLEIPKIKLNQGFYNIDNINNMVSKGIEVIEQSNMPNVKNGTLILASHSGNGQVSYFRNLYKLSYGDIIYIHYDKSKYKYELIDIYEVEKNGIVSIKNKKDITSLVLITCNKNDDNKQNIYISKLVGVL